MQQTEASLSSPLARLVFAVDCYARWNQRPPNKAELASLAAMCDRNADGAAEADVTVDAARPRTGALVRRGDDTHDYLPVSALLLPRPWMVPRS
jgi:hypothetical protein